MNHALWNYLVKFLLKLNWLQFNVHHDSSIADLVQLVLHIVVRFVVDHMYLYYVKSMSYSTFHNINFSSTPGCGLQISFGSSNFFRGQRICNCYPHCDIYAPHPWSGAIWLLEDHWNLVDPNIRLIPAPELFAYIWNLSIAFIMTSWVRPVQMTSMIKTSSKLHMIKNWFGAGYIFENLEKQQS